LNYIFLNFNSFIANQYLYFLIITILMYFKIINYFFISTIFSSAYFIVFKIIIIIELALVMYL